MGVNHDQFSHFSHLRPGSPAVILQTVVILAQIVSFVASGLNISLEGGGQCRQVVFVVVLWCCSFDRMGVNHDQFSHFSHLRPGLSTAMLQMVVIWPKSSLWWPLGSKSGQVHVVSVGKWCLWWSCGVVRVIGWV